MNTGKDVRQGKLSCQTGWSSMAAMMKAQFKLATDHVNKDTTLLQVYEENKQYEIDAKTGVIKERADDKNVMFPLEASTGHITGDTIGTNEQM